MPRNMWTWIQGLWREPSDWRSPDGEPLTRTERAKYDRLEERGAVLPTKFARFEIDPAWFPVGARMASTNDDPECPVRTSYSLPNFVDEYMFMDVGSTCGGLCGRGELRIYLWTGKHWPLIARRTSWLA